MLYQTGFVLPASAEQDVERRDDVLDTTRRGLSWSLSRGRETASGKKGMLMAPRLTIGIPTCARPAKVEACLASVRTHVDIEHDIIIVDSAITEKNRKLYESYSNARFLALDSPTGPAEARAFIAKETETPYLLYLDDDNEVTPGAVSTMYRFMEENADVDIVGSGWRENGRYRPIGQRFNFGITGKRKVVFKTFVAIEELAELKISSVRVDAVLATMMARRKVFERVQFDPRFGFFFDLFDFFLQCHQEQVHVAALPGVILEHKPGRYLSPTLAQLSLVEHDRRRFEEKWDLLPIGRIGGFRAPLLSRLRREGERLFQRSATRLGLTIPAAANRSK